MIELSYTTGIPRKTIGYHVTVNHYQDHLLSLWIYLGNGRKVDITIMRRPLAFKFYRYRNG